MSEQLTPERLAELRRVAEAATPGPWTADAGYIVVLGSDGWAEKRVACLDIDGNSMDDEYIAEFDPPTVLAMIGEVEKLRRERETLAGALQEIKRHVHGHLAWYSRICPDDAHYHACTRPAEIASNALLDTQQDAHTTTYRQMDECSDGWECTAPDCETAWTLPNGGPSHHRMRYCPGCGRRIVGEEPWRVEDGDGP